MQAVTSGDTHSQGGWTTAAMRLCLALTMLGACLTMHGISLQHNIVTVSGTPLLVYNLASIVFVFLAGASFFSLGSLLVPVWGARSGLDAFLLCSLAGFSLASILGFLLGMAGLLTFWAGLTALAGPLLWLPPRALPPYALSRSDALRLAGFAVLALYLLCVSGILFLYVENDFSHYNYVYDSALLRGDLRYSVPFFSYFYTKGAGGAFLMMAATSRLSMQLCTMYAMLMMLLMAYRLCAMVGLNSVAPLAAALLVLASKAMRIESYKGHTQISMFLLAVPYLTAQLSRGPVALLGRRILALGLTLCAAIVLSPQAAVFMVIPLLYWLWLTLRTRRYGRFPVAFLTCCAPALTFVAILAGNYLLTGIPDVTPMGFFSQFYNLDRVHGWISETALRMTLIESGGLEGAAFPVKQLLNLLLSAVVLGALYLWGRGRLRRERPVLLKRIELALAPAFAMGAACPLLYAVTIQSSIRRYVVFYAVLQGVYVVMAVLFSSAVLVPMLRRRFSWVPRPRRVAEALLAVACAYALIFSWTPKLKHQAEYTRYFFGQSSMAPMFGHWFAPEVAPADALVPDGEVVLPLYFSPYATMFKPQKYLRQWLNPYSEDLDVKLGPDAEKARAVYLRQGLRRFLVNLTTDPDPMISMVPEAYGALFSPANVAKHFRVRHVMAEVWLLTLDGSEADGDAPDQAFLAAYARKRRFDLENPRNIFYPTLERASKVVPSLVLAPKED